LFEVDVDLLLRLIDGREQIGQRVGIDAHTVLRCGAKWLTCSC
jgi:hypothetical protein